MFILRKKNKFMKLTLLKYTFKKFHMMGAYYMEILRIN